MNPSNPQSRRRKTTALPKAEILETRELLTAGAGDTFAIIPGSVTKSNQPAEVKFTINTSHFTMPNGKGQIGVDVATPSGSTLQPKILSITPVDSNGVRSPMTRAVYDPTVHRSNTSSGPMTSAVVERVGVNSLSHSTSATYSVKVTGTNRTTGNFLLGFYLPGDANGDGKVTNADVTLVKSELGAKAGTTNTKYTFDADANRDGKITAADLKLTRQNVGMSTNISPVVSANLDPSSTNGLQARQSTNQNVKFTGTATPGAAVKYTEINSLTPPVATTTDSSGNYSIVIPLAAGANTFNVSTQDSFGQSINGTIAPVTYVTQPVTNNNSKEFAALLQNTINTKPNANPSKTTAG